MAKGPDPRHDTAPLDAVPALLREGALEFDAARFWHAHEAWERAWHALRAAGHADAAAYVRGMILVAAALENARRGKEDGFKRQLAEGLHAMRNHPDAPGQLGLVAADAWVDELVALYLDACRRRDWSWWNGSGWRAPAVPLPRD